MDRQLFPFSVILPDAIAASTRLDPSIREALSQLLLQFATASDIEILREELPENLGIFGFVPVATETSR